MNELVFINGEYTPMAQATVSVLDRGFLFGDAVYEVVRCYKRRPFALQEHLDRLERSLEGVLLEIPYPRRDFEEICHTLLQRSQLEQSTIYFEISRGVAPRKHAFPEDAKPTVVAFPVPYVPPPAEVIEKGGRAITLPDNRWGRCDLKTVCLLPNILARETAKRQGVAEAIFLGPDQVVYEGTGSNVFYVKENVLYTHPLHPKILPGITRGVALRLAPPLGLDVCETPRTLNDFLQADEVFITGSSREFQSVTWIDNKPIAGGRPGPWTQKLYQAFLDYAARQCGLESCY